MPVRPPRVVVLTFFNAPCNDICPIVAAEIEQADADLGAQAAGVDFVTVNTDPTALAQSAEAPVLSGTHLGTLPNWHMVTGPLTTLNALWKAYGISISVQKKTGLQAHNDVMDFIDPQGNLRYRVEPVRQREHERDLQPGARQHRPLGPGNRHLRHAAGHPVTDPGAAPKKPPIWERRRGLVITFRGSSP